MTQRIAIIGASRGIGLAAVHEAQARGYRVNALARNPPVGRLLPLHLPLPFGDKDMIQKLMAYSGGLTGRITTPLAQAAELAIRQQSECISLDLLEQAASACIFRIPVEEETDDALANGSEESIGTANGQRCERHFTSRGSSGSAFCR